MSATWKVFFKKKNQKRAENQKQAMVNKWHYASIYNKKSEKFCKAKKQHLHEKFKMYGNSLASLTRQTKQNYYKKYFEENESNLIKVWKGIKKAILINKSNKTQPTCLKIGNKNINNKKTSQKNSITSLEQ